MSERHQQMFYKKPVQNNYDGDCFSEFADLGISFNIWDVWKIAVTTGVSWLLLRMFNFLDRDRALCYVNSQTLGFSNINS